MEAPKPTHNETAAESYPLQSGPGSAAKTFAEFFAGIGLMRMGLENAGWSIRFANDIAEDKEQMYARQFPDASQHFIREDIHALKANQVPSVTLATASFPCNDLSLAGGRRGLGGRQSSAYWGFIDILGKLGERRPRLVLLENVAGFLTSHKGKDFESALLALNNLGYSVDPLIIDAVNFVPQSRVRLFVVAKMTETNPAPTISDTPGFYESPVRPKAVADFIFSHPKIRWDIRRLPDPPKREMSLADVLEDLPDSSLFWWNRERRDYLVSQMSDKHSALLQKMKAGQDWSYGTVFRRVRKGTTMAEMRTDGIAGCLRTPRGGSARQILVKAGRGKVKVRLLTPTECARLMGADGFSLGEIPLNQALFGFGDAVCVPVIEWLAWNYLNPLLGEWSTQPQ